MKKHEANFSLKFRHWLMANPMKVRCWFEMKDTRGKATFQLSEWTQDQRDMAEAMLYSKTGVLVRTDGIAGLPDYKYSYQEPTFVVIKFNQGFVLIAADILAMQDKKTLTWEQACAIATIEGK